MTLEFIDYSKFTDIQYINRGQFGMVHKAKYKDKFYAIKIQSMESKRDETNPKFKGYETRIRMAELDHANIVRVMFSTRTNDIECIVLEYADFCLYDVLHKYKEMNYSPELGLLWILQIAKALDYLHTRPAPILHRDMKSPNLLLFGDGRTLKVTDFGHATDMHTVMTNCAGTMKWMAPEIIEGRSYTEACDVYSFSIITWEILSRKEPYSDGSFQNMFMPQFIMHVMQNNTRPEKIAGIPRVLDDIMMNCWQRDYKLRLTASCLVSMLEKLCHLCELVKPLQTKSGEYLRRTSIHKSLKHFIVEESSSFPPENNSFQREIVNGLEGLPNLLPFKPDKSSISTGIYIKHQGYITNYQNSNANLKRLMAEDVEVDKQLLQEEHKLIQIQGWKERHEELKKEILVAQTRRNELWYLLNGGNNQSSRY